ARHVADLVRRHEQLRGRFGDCGLHLRSRDPPARAERPALSERAETDATAKSAEPRPVAFQEGVGSRFARFLGRTPVTIFLTLLGLLWLLPTHRPLLDPVSHPAN